MTVAAVRAARSSAVVPGAVSTRTKPFSVTSSTPRSVMTRCTQARPVSGRAQRASSLGAPSRVVCSIRTMTRRAPCTRSIAPPMPLTILPGIIQLARSPCSLTCIAPSTAVSMWPPRIMPKERAESKKAAPGSTVTVSLPALIKSGSTSSSAGYGPTPRIPFSDWSVTCTPAGRWFGMSVGRPMPRLTYSPSVSSAAARTAICSRVQAIRSLPFRSQGSYTPPRSAPSQPAPSRFAVSPCAARSVYPPPARG